MTWKIRRAVEIKEEEEKRRDVEEKIDTLVKKSHFNSDKRN